MYYFVKLVYIKTDRKHLINVRYYCSLVIWASLVAQMVKNLPAVQETGFDPWVGRIPWRRERLPTPVFLPGIFPWTDEPGGIQSMGS